jgi:hypothetical protein
VEEVNILSGRQFALEIGFHFSVITIIQEQVRTMKLDTQRINDIPHKECKLLSSCIACLTSCITLKTMLRDVLDPKHKILQHMEWIMSDQRREQHEPDHVDEHLDLLPPST